MIKRDEKGLYKFPEGSLSSFSDYGLLIPFASKDSTMRQHMFHSHIRQTIIPINAERPLVDTRYTKDILFSTDNYLSKGKVQLIKKIEKRINNYLCDTTYIYKDMTDNLIYVERVPRYKSYSRFGYEAHSELDKLKEGEVSKGQLYTSYIDAMDTRDGGMGFGRNVNYIYTTDLMVGEDAFVITKDLAKDFAINTFYNPEIILDPNEDVLLDRYGKTTPEGMHQYQPFPLPGEETKDGVVAVLSKIGVDFLSVSDIIHDSDIVTYIHSGIVTDVEVYSNDPITNNPFLNNLRDIHKDYFKNIADALLAIEDKDLSKQAKAYKERLLGIVNEKLRIGKKQELKNKIRIQLKIVGVEELQAGSKITNRHGGKGTVTLIVDEPFYAEDGTRIDMLTNATGVVNRENIAQQVEQLLNTLNVHLMKYLRESSDDTDTKFNNIIKWIKKANLDDVLIQTINKYPKEEIVAYYAKNEMYMKYDPFDDDTGYLVLKGLVEFTEQLCPALGPQTIYYKGVPFGSKHVYGKAFYLALENGPLKDTSVRSDKINTAKGSLTKIGDDKKKYHAKYLSTAVKQSDLSLNISLTAQTDNDVELLTTDMGQLKQRLNAKGLEIFIGDSQTPDEEVNE